MKRLFTVLSVMFLSAAAFAQSPQKMSYQCVVRNASGALVTNQVVGIKISILQGSAGGTAVYTETLTPTTNANGLVSIEIGGETGFDLINWSAGPYFLKTETDPAGGTNYTITGTSQLLSVPYALYAKSAANGFSGNYNDLTDKPTLFDGAWVSLTGKPTTIAGYGITDAVTTSGDQTISGHKTFTGATTVPTPVNETDATTKAYVDLLLERIEMLEGSIVKDVDGNVYSTTEIGNQIWMAENLKTTHYKDGTAITLVSNNGDWFKLSTPGYCWYNNDEATYKNSYGALYNGYVVTTEKLCPTGWHVPTDAEWTTLTTYLGGESVAGGKLKETGLIHWRSPNTGATNEIDFTALPGGGRSGSTGSFDYIRDYGYWWSSTEYASIYLWSRKMNYDDISVSRSNNQGKNMGFSVRCIKN
jgi:uncharacterized protein (TIGR02145 family)